MYQHLMVPPAPPSTVNPQLSRDTDTVLLRALAKQPEERFVSITAFANAFQQAAHAQSTPEANAPTYLSASPTPASTGDIRAVLAISTAEAQTGTTRTLTLPGGRRVSVPLSAGIRDGQIVRLDGQGEALSAGGPAGADRRGRGLAFEEPDGKVASFLRRGFATDCAPSRATC